ncbi:hypothetical protein [Leptolyngbya sp. FACHB-671]|uniref:hypothetical protein n=1 Tax=Leptolyngbya sp. FACHB-671 TaxID=2692812 RepID=UPI001A7E345D|nr:hypothetical protein [Leptolyngbya sp. FACHB-671]
MKQQRSEFKQQHFRFRGDRSYSNLENSNRGGAAGLKRWVPLCSTQPTDSRTVGWVKCNGTQHPKLDMPVGQAKPNVPILPHPLLI